MLRDLPSGHLFGWSQNAGMGWNPVGARRQGIPDPLDPRRHPRARRHADRARLPHRPLGSRPARGGRRADVLAGAGAIPFAAACTDPCDGRSQGTTAMFDSLPVSATTRRRSSAGSSDRCRRGSGVLGVATCDKGLPAMMMALAGSARSAVRARAGRRHAAGRARAKTPAAFSRSACASCTARSRSNEAADLGCRACASPGGGCQFLGTAATAQVVGEALGMALGHAALAPSGHPIWLDMARRSARALMRARASSASRCATSSPTPRSATRW